MNGKQTSGYQRGDGRQEGQIRGMRLTDTSYSCYVFKNQMQMLLLILLENNFFIKVQCPWTWC